MAVKIDDSRKAATRQAENMLKMGYTEAETADHARGCIIGYMTTLAILKSNREAFDFIMNEADNRLLLAIHFGDEKKPGA